MKNAGLGPMYPAPDGSLVVGSSVGSSVGPSVVSMSHPTFRLVFGHLPSSYDNFDGNLNPSMKSMMIYIAAGNFERDHVNPEDLSFLITMVFSVT